MSDLPARHVTLRPGQGWLRRLFAAAMTGLSMLRLASAEPEVKYQRYWGDVHGHTMFSDGKGTVAEYFQHARDTAQLDFAIVTDHDFGCEAPWRMPKAHWQQTQAAADEFTVNGRFVAIAGYEWTSQPKYWEGFTNGPSERLFAGPPRYYNHKNVYFLKPVDHLFSAKDAATMTPDLLAAAMQRAGGLIHNNHPTANPDYREQFDYEPQWFSVIANTEMLADSISYEGKTNVLLGEQLVRAFLNRGGRTGFVGGSDTHEGQPSARTAVLARALTRDAIFEALRSRRNYAVSRTRIELDFQINGHWMGEEILVNGPPRLRVAVQGTTNLAEVIVVRNGEVCHQISPDRANIRFTWEDDTFPGNAYYYVRVTLADPDTYGNPSRAWSSPIWVRAERR